MHRWLTYAVERHADRPLFGRSFLYRDLGELMNKYTKELRIYHDGRPGKRMALSEENGPHFLARLGAMWSLQAIPCLVSPTMPAPAREHCLRMIRETPAVENNPEREALVLFTSGTSSPLPKGVRLSHDNLLHHTQMLDQHMPHHFLNEWDRTVPFLPWTHCYGLMGECFSVLDRGASMSLIHPSSPRLDPRRLWHTIRQQEPSILFVVPRILEMIRERGGDYLPWIPRRLCWGSNLRYLMCGGARLSPTTRSYFKERLHIPIYEGYGCTEMSPMIALQNSVSHSGEALPLLPGIDVKIDNITQEIKVRGKNRFLGYLGEPSLSSMDNWHATGDRGALNSENRHLTVYGRLGNRIKLPNGRFLDLEKAESFLRDHFSIPHACAWQDSETGQLRALLFHPLHSSSSSSPLRRPVMFQGETIQCRPRSLQLLSLETGTLTPKGELCRSALQPFFSKEQ